jgi:hypothetical protein
MSPEAIRDQLKQLADKPDSAIVPVAVAAEHDGVWPANLPTPSACSARPRRC